MRHALPLAFAVVLACTGDARAQPRTGPAQLDEPSLGRLASAPLDVHEWGVWRLRAGRVDHLADLARETPAFVHRAASGPPPVTPRPANENVEIALKPVVFLHADTPLDVTVTIEMPGGEPWLYFPDAVAGITEPPAVRTVRWSGRVLPAAAALPRGVSFPTAAPGHWWNALRGAGASPFVPTGASLAERFLFYDGPIPFRALWEPRAGSVVPARTAARNANNAAWVLGPQGASRVASRGQRVVSRSARDVGAVRTDLGRALERAGLTAAEAHSLLTTWDGDLFQSTAPRAVWLVGQRQYDGMLPIRVEPRPRSIVRVGVVIQML